MDECCVFSQFKLRQQHTDGISGMCKCVRCVCCVPTNAEQRSETPSAQSPAAAAVAGS